MTRDREAVEARNALHSSLDRIPADLHDKLLSVLTRAEQTQQSFDVFMCYACPGANCLTFQIQTESGLSQGSI